jgi:hypothetical protein
VQYTSCNELPGRLGLSAVHLRHIDLLGVHNRGNVSRASILCTCMPLGSAPGPDPAEAARNEREVRAAEALIAELQNRRIQSSRSNADAPVGVIGWLVERKIVAGESQANIALLGVAIIAAVLAAIIFCWSNSGLANPDKSLISRPQPTAPITK